MSFENPLEKNEDVIMPDEENTGDDVVMPGEDDVENPERNPLEKNEIGA